MQDNREGKEPVTHNLTQTEIDVLRLLNGEDVPGLFAGAAVMECAAHLKDLGLAEGVYTISDEGKAYLAALDKKDET